MGKKILVVDDEKDIIELLQYNLSRAGYDVSSAREGGEALRRAASIPDLILLDVMIPQMDGYEVIKHLKQNPLTRNIAGAFLTAKGMEIDEVVGLALGANDYIVKPISISRLLARIKTVLHRKELERQPGIFEENIVIGKLEIDVKNTSFASMVKKSVYRKKFETLLFLARKHGNVVTRDEMLTSV